MHHDLSVIGSSAPDAIGLGRYFDFASNTVGDKIRYGGDRHILVFGPNGTGKGMRLLAPNLLQCSNRSIFVIDPKGELAAMTAAYRRTLGKVVILNPFGVLTDIPGYADLRSVGFNPLRNLDPNSQAFNSDVAALADAMIKVQGKDPHWDNSARALVAFLIMHATIEAKRQGTIPTLAQVRDLLGMYSEGPHKENGYRAIGIPKIALKASDSPHDGLRNKASQFCDWTDETRSIASTARIQTECFDDDQVASDMARDGFDFREMKKQPVTVYCILPPEAMARHSKWLRMVLTAALQSVLRVRQPGEPRVLFMLDEFAALGHLEIIETVWALVRGYGIQMMPVFQDLTQLKGLYGERWETFIANAGAVASLGPNDLTTAQWLSRRAGDRTAVVLQSSEGSSSGTSGNHSTSSGGQGSSSSSFGSSSGSSKSTSSNQTKVPLIDPHKLFGMRDGAMLLAAAGTRDLVPVFAPGYWQIRQCVERARRNPYFE